MDAHLIQRTLPTPGPRPSLRLVATGDPTDDLWDEVARCTSGDRREELLAEIIVANLDLARTLARRYHRRGEEPEDLEQVAFVGLTKAVRGFEPGRGVAFASYAVPTILGELKRHFRDSCWSVRPPRRIQELQARLGAAAAELQQRLHRTPTAAELAAELGVPVSEAQEAQWSNGCYSAQSLDVGGEGLAGHTDRLSQEDTSLDRLETVLMLSPLLADLPDRERRILGRRFCDEWSQQQIAGELGITQMQVSRLLRRMLAKMREHLELEAPMPQAG